MKLIGLIGGLSWESSSEYYRIINQSVQRRLGGVHSARILMYSFDFGAIEALQAVANWTEATQMMIEAAASLERGGADFIVICSNTMHLMADEVTAALATPILHIADPTAERIKATGLHTVGLLGTAFTMEQDFYRGRLKAGAGLDVLIPEPSDRRTVHGIIYQELVRGVVRAESRDQFKAIIRRLVDRGAEGIILGCTEIMLLVNQDDAAVPLFDTTALHAEAAVIRALSLAGE